MALVVHRGWYWASEEEIFSPHGTKIVGSSHSDSGFLPLLCFYGLSTRLADRKLLRVLSVLRTCFITTVLIRIIWMELRFVQHFHFNSLMLFWLISHPLCTITSYGWTISHIAVHNNWNPVLWNRSMKYSRCSADFNMSNAAMDWFLKCVTNIHLVLLFKLNI